MRPALTEGVVAERFGALVGVERPILCRSGAEAFLVALLALAVGPGDEVLLPVSICQSMVNAVLITGALPVLVDCHPDLCMDAAAAHARCTDATRLVVAHHPHGAACDLTALRSLCDAVDVPLLEDCAQSLGAHPVGTIGDLLLWSFAPGKPLDAGGGGAVAARAPDLHARIGAAARVGASGDDTAALGFDARPGLGILERLWQALDGFEAAIAHRLALVEAVRPALSTLGVVLHDTSDRSPPGNVHHRIIVRCATRHGRARIATLIERAHARLPSHVWRVTQASVPTPPYATRHLNQRYRRMGRPDLCDPTGLGFPGWRQIEATTLFLRTLPCFTPADLLSVVEALSAAQRTLQPSRPLAPVQIEGAHAAP